MFTKLQSWVVAFFSRPAVQSVVRHVVLAALAVVFVAFMHGGVAAVVSSVTAVAVVRAVWAVLRPVVVDEVGTVAADEVPMLPQTAAGAVVSVGNAQ